MTSRTERYLALVKAPGTWEKVLTFYAALCAAYLFMGVQETLREPGLGLLAGVLAGAALVPCAAFAWARLRPVARIATDGAVWLLLLLAVAGAGLALSRCDRSELLDLLMLIVLIPALFAGCLWGYLAGRLKKEAALTKAGRTGWRLSREEEAALGLDEVVLMDMTPKQRLLHGGVLALGPVVFLCVVTTFLLSPVEAYVGFTLLWLVFLFTVVGLTVYFSSLFRRQFVQKKRTAVELDAARRMQMSLMPKEDPRVAGLEVSGVTMPAEEVGGDLFAYLVPLHSEGVLAIAVGDVSGKAMKAAFATVLVSGMLKTEIQRSCAPAEMLARVNDALLGNLDPHAFVAMQVLLFDRRTGRVTYSNAGQVHPYLLRRGGVTPIEQSALPLGLSGAAEYLPMEIALEEGDLLVLVSDGITEAMNARRELFGYGRLEEALRSLDPERPARELVEELVGRVDQFRGDCPPSDDRTVVVVRRTAEPSGPGLA